MENKNNNTTLIIVATIVGLIGILIGYLVGANQQENKTAQITSSCQEELAAAKKVVEGEFQVPKAEYIVSGVIKSIEEDIIVLEIDGFLEQESPWSEPKEVGTKTRKITISPETILIDEQAREEENDEEITEESSEEQSFSREDLKEGMFISVQSDVDIKTNEEFTATEVYLLQR